MTFEFFYREDSVSPLRSSSQRVELPPLGTNGSVLEEEVKSIPPPDSPLGDLDISRFLVFKKQEEEGPDIRGGHPDALIIHATKANKNGKSFFVNTFILVGLFSLFQKGLMSVFKLSLLQSFSAHPRKALES